MYQFRYANALVSKYDVLLAIDYNDTAVDMVLKHRISEFHASSIANTFGAVLETILHSPEQTLANLDPVSHQDKAQVLQWLSKVPPRINSCVHDLLDTQISSSSNLQAICAWDGTFTYREMDRLSSQLSHHLIELGIKPGSLVPFCFEKSKWAIISILAILKSGGACVPIDPNHPQSKKELVLKDVDAKVLLTSSLQSHSFSDPAVYTQVVDESIFSSIPDLWDRPHTNVSPEDPVYLIYTSGSTGVPKGVIWEHSTLSSSITHHGRHMGFQKSTRMFQFAAYIWDVSVMEMLTTLLCGGCVCIPSDDDRMNEPAKAIFNLKANFAMFTPVSARSLEPGLVPGLQNLCIGGDSITHELIAMWTPHVHLSISYGPAEACIMSSQREVMLGDTAPPKSIGRAVGCVQVVVNKDDPNLLAPFGSVGEILIGGPILARGYLNDTVKTNKAFILNPHWSQSKEETKDVRFYRTGDLGMYNSLDGSIIFVGRLDRQVKIRGQRMELEEVERALERASQVQNAAVILPKTGLHANKLVAVLTRSGTSGGSELKICDDAATMDVVSDIREYAIGKLPQYMIPTFWVVVEGLPLTLSCKLDRAKIVAWLLGMSETVAKSITRLASKIEPVTTPTEKQLQRIWSTVLKIPQPEIGANSSFLRLGGDSITAMQVVAVCRQENFSLTVQDIFRNKTISEIAVQIQSAQMVPSDKMAEGCLPLSSGNRISGFPTLQISDHALRQLQENISQHPRLQGLIVENILPVTSVQQSSIAESLLKNHAGLNYMMIRIQGPLDQIQLKYAAGKLVKANAILRTVFMPVQSQLLQVVLQSIPLEFERVHGKVHTNEDPSGFILEDVKIGVKLGEPLVKFLLVEHSLDDYTLILRIHHAQYDHTSATHLLRQVSVAYNNGILDSHAEYSEFFIARQLVGAKSRSYWKELLQGSFMTNIIHRTGPSYNLIPDHKMEKIVSVNDVSEYDIQMATLVKAAWAFTFSRISKTQDVVFGEVVRGRNLRAPGIESITGPCINIIPIRTRMSDDWTVRKLIKEIEDQQYSSAPYENLDYDEIRNHCTNWPSWSEFGSVINHRTPVSKSTFASENQAWQFDGFYGTLSEGSDIEVVTFQEGNSITMKLSFCSGVIPVDFMKHVLDDFCANLRSFSEDFDTRLLDLPQTIPAGYGIPFVPDLKPIPVSSSESTIIDSSTRELVEQVWGTACGSDNDSEKHVVASDTPYYDVWKSGFVAPQLASIYQARGIAISVEDIIDHPTINLQAKLCANWRKTHLKDGYFP